MLRKKKAKICFKRTAKKKKRAKICFKRTAKQSENGLASIPEIAEVAWFIISQATSAILVFMPKSAAKMSVF